MYAKPAPKVPALDRFISWVSPTAGLRRARARAQTDHVRRYEGAAGGRRTESWLTQSTSANAETAIGLSQLRNRCRDMVRNNPWAARAVQAVVSNTIGHGITAKVSGPKRVSQLWRQWAESTDCDADGLNDIYGLQALILRSVAESGECLVRRRWRRPGDGLSLPMQLQVIEGDYLDHSRTTMLDTGRIVQGVEFDAIGRRVAYWLFEDHPGDLIGRIAESKRVPASEVAHIYRRDRPGQVRGVPWAAPCMLSLYDLDGYEDAYLFRQKLANCYVGYVQDMNGAETPAAGGSLAEAMEPGRLELLPNGKTIELSKPPDAGDYGPFTRDVLLRVAATFGITFQALTGDLSTVNFSSGRMGWLEMGRNIDGWRWHMLIPQGLETITRWFSEAAQLYAGLRTDAMSFQWTPPRREMIDPAGETSALVMAIRAGTKSYQGAMREYGEDAEVMLDEIQAHNKMLDDREIVLASDPRRTTQAGLLYEPPPATTPKDTNA